MKKKIDKVICILQLYSEINRSFFNCFNDETYDKTVSPYENMIEDLICMTLFNFTYDELYDMFTTPGCKEKGKIILWDDKNGGYPLEKMINIAKNGKDLNIENFKYQVKLINAALKKI